MATLNSACRTAARPVGELHHTHRVAVPADERPTSRAATDPAAMEARQGRNLLLNVGPKPDGAPPEEQVSRLMAWAVELSTEASPARRLANSPASPAWFTRRGTRVCDSDRHRLDAGGGYDRPQLCVGSRTYGKRCGDAARPTGTETVVSYRPTAPEYNDAGPGPRRCRMRRGARLGHEQRASTMRGAGTIRWKRRSRRRAWNDQGRPSLVFFLKRGPSVRTSGEGESEGGEVKAQRHPLPRPS